MSINSVDGYKVSHVFDTDVKMTKTAGQVLHEALWASTHWYEWPTETKLGKAMHEAAAQAVIAWHEAQQWRPMNGQVIAEFIDGEIKD